jgi:hypothetical protein
MYAAIMYACAGRRIICLLLIPYIWYPNPASSAGCSVDHTAEMLWFACDTRHTISFGHQKQGVLTSLLAVALFFKRLHRRLTVDSVKVFYSLSFSHR